MTSTNCSLGILVGFLLWKRRLGLPYYVGWHQVVLMNRIKDDRQPYHYLCFSLCYWCHDVVSAIISTYDDDDDYCEVGPSYICSPTWGGEKLKVRLFHFHFLLHTFLALQFGVRERNFTPSDEFWEKVYFYVRLLYCTWGHGGNFHYLKLECAVTKLKQKSTF